jgi:hypothetical protein
VGGPQLFLAYPSRFVSDLTVALHRRLPHCEHRSRPHDIRQHRIPPGKPCERLRLRGARVAALALERQDILAEVVGQPDDGE